MNRLVMYTIISACLTLVVMNASFSVALETLLLMY